MSVDRELRPQPKNTRSADRGYDVARPAREVERAPRRTPIDDLTLTLGASDGQRAAFNDAIAAVHASLGRGSGGSGAPVQFRGDVRDAGAVDSAVATGTRGAAGDLPFRSRIQEAFGRHDLGHVRAHVGAEATSANDTLGSLGFTRGERVAFKGAPSLFTAAHEAAHVVQQRAGVRLQDGVGRPGDVYERHADEVATLVVAGRSAESTLDRFAGGRGGGAGGGPVQLQADASAGAAPAAASEPPETYYATDTKVPDAAPEAPSTDLSMTLHESEDEDMAVLDLVAMSGDAQGQLDAMVKDLDKQIAEKKAARAATSDLATQDSLDQELRVLEQDKTSAAASKDALAKAGAGVTEADLTAAVKSNDLEVKKVSKATSASEVKLGTDGLSASSTTVTPSGAAGTAKTQVDASLGLDGTGKVAVAKTDSQMDVTRVDSASVEGNALAGTGSASASTETSEKIGDQTKNESVSGSASVALDGGVATTASISHEDSVKDADGNVVSSDKITAESSQKLVLSDGTGVSQGASLAGTSTRDGITLGAKASASGLFKVDVVPVAGEPPTYEIHLTIELGGSVGGSLGGEAKTKIQGEAASGKLGASANVSAKGSLALVHRLGAEEAKAYLTDLDAVDAGGTPATTYPELSRLRELVLAAGEMDASGVAALTGGAQGARDMANGDSVTLTLSGGVSGSLEGGGTVGGFGASGKVSGSAQWTRTLVIAKVGSGVRATLSFSQATSLDAEGSVTVEGATAGGGIGTADSDAIQVAFMLDPASPAYEGAMGRVEGALTPEDARALASDPALKAQLESLSGTIEHSDSTSTTIGASGVEMKLGDKATMSETHTAGADGASTNVTGTHEASGSIGTSNLALGGSRTDAMSVDVGPDGMSATLTEGESGNDMAAGAAAEAAELGKADLAEKVTGQSITGRLKDVWSKMTTDLHGYNLTESDLETLVARAGDSRTWGMCAAQISYKLMDAWEALRRGLVSPMVDPAEAAEDPAMARRLAIARALCTFAKDNYRSTDVFEQALRHWGESGTTYGDGARLGTQFEWPAELAATKSKYDKATAALGALPGALAPLATVPDGMVKASAKRDAITKDLEATKRDLSAADLIPEARSEMLGVIAGQEGTLASAWATFENDWARKASQRAAAAGECADIPTVSDEDQMSLAPPETTTTPAQDPALAGLRAQAKGLEEVCLRNHHAEQDVLRDVENSLYRREGGKLANPEDVGMWEGAKSAYYHDDYGAVMKLSDLHKLALDWVQKIKELKSLYVQAAIPKADQVLGSPTWIAQGIVLTPDLERMIRLYEGACEGENDTKSIAIITSQWRQQIRW